MGNIKYDFADFVILGDKTRQPLKRPLSDEKIIVDQLNYEEFLTEKLGQL